MINARGVTRAAVVAAMVIALLGSAAAGGDVSSLTWQADSGIRVPGGSYPAVTSTFVMQRADGLWGMYYYLGDAETYGNTGYSTSTDGMTWSAPATVMTHGGNGYDNVTALIQDVVTLPNGHYRAYCTGMESNQGSAPTSIFYADSVDGTSWTWTKDSVLFNGRTSLGQVGSPRVISSGSAYTMYFYRGASLQRTTSTDGTQGLSWASPQTVISSGLNDGSSFDIVSAPGGGYRMFAPTASGNIGSLSSADGLSWTWDSGDRLTRSAFGVNGPLGAPVVANINGTAKMYVTARPNPSNDLSNIYSATGVARTLSGVPEYGWRRGCTPTSATMLMAYWSQNDYANLWNGTPPTSNDPGNDSDPVNVVIEHIGDIMGTSSAASGGNTAITMNAYGMTTYAAEKGGSYAFAAGNKYVSAVWWDVGSWFEGFSFEYLRHEVDAGRPMLVGLKLKVSGDTVGHAVAAYGYQDNPGKDNDWIAVQDTWVDRGGTGHYAITNKVEGGTEWWKWVTDTGQSYYIFSGTWLIPGVSAKHSVWGLLESRFEDKTAFFEQFSVTKTSSGSAELATLTGAPQESVLRIHSAGTQGIDDCLVSSLLPGTDVIKLSLKYAFETSGTLDILLGGHLLVELVDPVGLGTVADPTDFLKFSQEFALADYGLSPDESYELVLRLLAGSEHTLFLDDLQITDPAASPIPEPASLSLLILGGLAVMAQRRWRK